MSQLEKRFFLRDNPFGIVPTRDVEVWANRAKLRAELEDLIKNILVSSPSRLVACFHGDWGAGKTHMASYFSRRDILRKYASELKVKEPFPLQILMPAREMLDSMYFGILDPIGVNTLKKAVDALLPPGQVISLEKQIEKLEQVVLDRILAIAFRANEQLLQAYLYQIATARDLKSMRIPRGITLASDKLKVLRAALNLLTKNYSRVILWIDDAERLGELSGKDLSEFQIFMRDLFDFIPNNLNIIMLFTLTPGRKVADTLSYMGDALRSRLYRIIQVEDLKKDDFLQYVTDLLNHPHYRLPDTRKKIDEHFPFDGRATLEYIYQEMKDKDAELKKKDSSLALTPRNINQIFSRLLELALKDPKLKIIDKSLVDKLMAEF